MISVFFSASEGYSRFGPGNVQDDQLFTSSQSCSKCHNDLFSADEEVDTSYVSRWETTMMRFSFYDPFWRAKVRSETIQNPEYQEQIEKKCLPCHAPMAYKQMEVDDSPQSLFDSGGLIDSTNPYHNLAMEGISCTLCHQIMEDETHSGSYSIAENRVAWGPYNPDYQNMMNRLSGFTPEQSSHLNGPGFCAACHELYTPYFDEDGNFITDDPFPEQTPYGEWLASSYSEEGGETCQSCHMQKVPSSVISKLPDQVTQREDVFVHTFFTENTMMLDIITSLAEEEGLDIPDITDAVDDGRDYLEGAGEIEITQSGWQDFDMDGLKNDLTVTLEVINNSGHKLPTSIPIRRVFIHFAVYGVQDNGNEVEVFSSGNTDEEGRIVGVEADDNNLAYEPHYDQITNEEQVQIYEGIMGRIEGEIPIVTYTLLQASMFIKDNRLLPKGMDPLTAPEDIQPKGEEVVNDGNFTGGKDTIVYIARNLKNMNDNAKHNFNTFRIEAELKDQTLSYRMIHELEDVVDDDSGVIERFLEEHQHHKLQYELIHRDEEYISAIE
ncbi:hypothetical protein [Desulfosediminicola flagellatus]|uniref:hypothetical protein n=1 Tax=Desulfosediminicola flagellatus TaxID=2569541 RepID=UPI0010AD537D|nr:hypothetical protein [Desulfosediminicola flagellatus]